MSDEELTEVVIRVVATPPPINAHDERVVADGRFHPAHCTLQPRPLAAVAATCGCLLRELLRIAGNRANNVFRKRVTVVHVLRAII